MRPLLLLLLVAGAAPAQPFSAGIKAGLPLTNLLDNLQPVDTTAVTNRYLFGPEVEVRLPHGLSVEFDALYRRFSYTHFDAFAASTITTIGSSGDWELPLVAKYRFPARIVRPYVEAGVAWDTLSGLKNTVSGLVTSAPAAQSQSTLGVVIGGGLDIHAMVIHITPELRFTRWAQQYFNLSGVLNSGKNQAEFLVGFTF